MIVRILRRRHMQRRMLQNVLHQRGVEFLEAGVAWRHLDLEAAHEVEIEEMPRRLALAGAIKRQALESERLQDRKSVV